MDQHSPSAPRTSESSENDLAKRLWHHGFRRWLEVNPRWTMGRPFTAHRRVYFPVTDATRSFQIVVEDATLASQSEFRGRHLALRAQGELPSPRVVNELGQIVMRLDAKGLSFPAGGTDAKRVELFISSACNLQCYFCIESERINSRSFMPWETIEKHLRENAARGVQLIQFMGGEATIHPRFVDALRLCRELGMRTFVITNLLRWARMDFAEGGQGSPGRGHDQPPRIRRRTRHPHHGTLVVVATLQHGVRQLSRAPRRGARANRYRDVAEQRG
ncbi:MAG: radical SAM protein [Sandaracinaceae bacterium]|nr:radical SAM protein [Sandaracinaceae bacterium]